MKKISGVDHQADRQAEVFNLKFATVPQTLFRNSLLKHDANVESRLLRQVTRMT